MSDKYEVALMRFYELAPLYRRLQDEILENDGELTPELEAELDDVADTFEERAGYFRKMFLEMKASADATRREADRLAKMAQARERACDRMKAFIQAQFDAAGIVRLDLHPGVMRIQRNSQPSVDFNGDLGKLPSNLVRTKMEPNREAALAEFKETGKVPEGYTITQGYHLRIT